LETNKTAVEITKSSSTSDLPKEAAQVTPPSSKSLPTADIAQAISNIAIAPQIDVKSLERTEVQTLPSENELLRIETVSEFGARQFSLFRGKRRFNFKI
jgi:hypothetical protein